MYRAKLSTSEQTTSGNIVNVPFTYTDNSGEHTENFTYDNSKSPVISAKPLSKMTTEEITKHQSHDLSYGDENGQNCCREIVRYKKMQSRFIGWLVKIIWIC